MNGETWLSIAGARYEVSDQGRVRSLKRKKPHVLVPIRDDKGYLSVNLYPDAGPKRYAKIHHLVLEAFVGPRPFGQECRHLDGSKTNNALSNLAWGTRSENSADKIRHGTCVNANKTHCPKGHPYDDENTLVRGNGRYRDCRICARAAQRAYRARKRAALAAPKRVAS